MAFLRGRADSAPTAQAAPRFAPFARFRQQPPAAATAAASHLASAPAAEQEHSSSRLPELPAAVARLLPCLEGDCPCTACGSTLEFHGRGRLGDCNVCTQRDATEPLGVCHECSTCGRRHCIVCCQMQTVKRHVTDANGQVREVEREKREKLQAAARGAEGRTRNTWSELAATRDEHASASDTLASFKERAHERRALLAVELAGGRGALTRVLEETKVELQAKDSELQALQLRLSDAKAAIPGPTPQDLEAQAQRKELERLRAVLREKLENAARSEAYVKDAARGDAELRLELTRFREDRARVAARQVLAFVGLRAELVAEQASAAVAKASADALADEACAGQAPAASRSSLPVQLPGGVVPGRARACSAPAAPIPQLDDFLGMPSAELPPAFSPLSSGVPASASSGGPSQKPTLSEQLSEQLAPAAAGAAAHAGRFWDKLQKLAVELDPMPPIVEEERVPAYSSATGAHNAEKQSGDVSDLRGQCAAWERKLDSCAQQLDWMEQQLHARDAEVHLLTNDVAHAQRDYPTSRAAATKLRQELGDERQQMHDFRDRLHEELRRSIASCRKRVEARFQERPTEAQQRSDLEGVFGDSCDWAGPAGPSVGLAGGSPVKEKARAMSFSMHEGYVSAGDDLLVAQLTVEEAKLRCETLGPSCAGFTFQSKGGSGDDTYRVFFKRKWDVHGKGQATGWLSFRREEDLPALPNTDMMADALGSNSVGFADFDALCEELDAAASRTGMALKAVPRRRVDDDCDVSSATLDEEGPASSERRKSVDDADGGARFLSMATPSNTPPRSRENSW